MNRHHELINSILEHKTNRRGIIKASAMASICLALFPKLAIGAISKPQSVERSLSLYNLHTDESLKTVYWFKGEYIQDALTEINYILRDFRTNEIKEIDKALLDCLFTIRSSMETKEKLLIISGYRSPVTNAGLNKISCGVARNSLHMQGKAADIRIEGKSLESLWKTARSLKLGGVGYYPASDFVHVDVGRVRYW
jgi:uncharacterized protein YcbK (DUF882 family)